MEAELCPTQRIRNHSFSFRGKFWAQAFVHCFSLQTLCCTRTSLTNSKQAQSCSSRDMCQGVTLWYNHLSSSFVSFYCAITWELVSHFWAMTFFPFILWSWNINHNNILIFGSSCFYNTYLYFPSYYVFEIELSQPVLVSNLVCNWGWHWLSDPPVFIFWMLRLWCATMPSFMRHWLLNLGPCVC